jgi:hypothetical protein
MQGGGQWASVESRGVTQPERQVGEALRDPGPGSRPENQGTREPIQRTLAESQRA